MVNEIVEMKEQQVNNDRDETKEKSTSKKMKKEMKETDEIVEVNLYIG